MNNAMMIKSLSFLSFGTCIVLFVSLMCREERDLREGEGRQTVLPS